MTKEYVIHNFFTYNREAQTMETRKKALESLAEEYLQLVLEKKIHITFFSEIIKFVYPLKDSSKSSFSVRNLVNIVYRNFTKALYDYSLNSEEEDFFSFPDNILSSSEEMGDFIKFFDSIKSSHEKKTSIGQFFKILEEKASKRLVNNCQLGYSELFALATIAAHVKYYQLDRILIVPTIPETYFLQDTLSDYPDCCNYKKLRILRITVKYCKIHPILIYTFLEALEHCNQKAPMIFYITGIYGDFAAKGVADPMHKYLKELRKCF